MIYRIIPTPTSFRLLFQVPGPGLLFQVRVLGFLPRKDAWSDNVSEKEAATELVLLRGQARNQTKQQ